MKIKYVSEFLSIKQFDDLEINDFAVITGLNGAGKSHLLNAIDKGNVLIEGIVSDKIILYNFNDFNVYNIDLNHQDNQTSSLKNRQSALQSKSNSASQKFQQERNDILSSFNINRNFGSIYLDDHILYNIEYYGVLNWSEDDKEYYQNFEVSNPDTSYSNYVNILNFHSYLSNYQVHKIDNINKFIEFFKDTQSRIQALNLIIAYNYNKEFKSVDESKFLEILEIVRLTPQFDFWNEENRGKYPQFIIEIIQHLIHSTNNLDINPLLFVNNLKIVYKEIEDHFKSQIDKDSLKLIQNINGNNVLDYIYFDNGFFNLNDIAQEEKNYQLNIRQNEINEFLRSKGQNVQVYTDEELLLNFGDSPVKILNDVLNEYDVNGYEFRNSDLQLDIHSGMHNQRIRVYLYNKDSNFETNLDALSSGEKTLIALAFSIFKLKKKKILANVLLMDELDSALHPSMSKRLINVLHNYFHKTLGLKIIISSHSPSTIAFSPDDSLYVIKKDKTSKLLYQVSKDEALKELTIGVPSFSINYENRKQVFVESKYDVEYYSSLYEIFKNYLDKEISLNFIASGDVRKNDVGQSISSCDVVKSVAKVLRDSGNNSIYGIVDWDLANTKIESPYIITLGFNSRYSIENYIFDPLIVGIFLLKEKIVKPDYFGFDDNFRLQSLFNLTIYDCQKIIDKICKTISEEIARITIINFINKSFPDTITDENFSDNHLYETINGFELQIPYFIRVLQGHKLEEYLVKIFPQFNAYSKGKEDLLKKEFIQIVIEDFIDYTPRELLEVFLEIQK